MRTSRASFKTCPINTKRTGAALLGTSSSSSSVVSAAASPISSRPHAAAGTTIPAVRAAAMPAGPNSGRTCRSNARPTTGSAHLPGAMPPASLRGTTGSCGRAEAAGPAPPGVFARDPGSVRSRGGGRGGRVTGEPSPRDRSCGYPDRRAATTPTVAANRLFGLPRSSDFYRSPASVLRTLAA